MTARPSRARSLSASRYSCVAPGPPCSTTSGAGASGSSGRSSPVTRYQVSAVSPPRSNATLASRTSTGRAYSPGRTGPREPVERSVVERDPEARREHMAELGTIEVALAAARSRRLDQTAPCERHAPVGRAEGADGRAGERESGEVWWNRQPGSKSSRRRAPGDTRYSAARRRACPAPRRRPPAERKRRPVGLLESRAIAIGSSKPPRPKPTSARRALPSTCTRRQMCPKRPPRPLRPSGRAPRATRRRSRGPRAGTRMRR